MNRFRPFLTSLGVHALLIALGVSAYTAVRTQEPLVVPLRLLTQPPQSTPSPRESEPSAPVPIPEPSRQIVKESTPKPVAKTPLPVAAPQVPITASAPAAAVIAPLTPAEPAVIPKAPPKNELRSEAPPPPPPVSVQERYEEENLAQIRSILIERLVYPKNALRLHQQGEVVVTFSLTPDKEVKTITVTKSSEFELLDDAAVKLITSSASSFPKPSKTVRITVPIGYKIR